MECVKNQVSGKNIYLFSREENLEFWQQMLRSVMENSTMLDWFIGEQDEASDYCMDMISYYTNQIRLAKEYCVCHTDRHCAVHHSCP